MLFRSLAYLLTIVRILKGGQPPQEMPPHMLATGLLNKERKILMERFDMVISNRRLVSKWCRGAFWALFFTLFFLSYCFILQPAYDPPREDIYTDDSVIELDSEDFNMVENPDGSVSIVLPNGESYPVKDHIADLLDLENSLKEK